MVIVVKSLIGKDPTGIKSRLKNGMVVIIGYYSFLITPDMPEFFELIKYTRPLHISEAKKKVIVQKIINAIKDFA